MSHPAAKVFPWRSPVLWLVAGLPLLVVVATVVTLRLAARERSDSSRAEVRKIAQIQLEDLAPDQVAQQRGFAAALVADAQRGMIDIVPNAALAASGVVVLDMLHPLDELQDRRLVGVVRAGAWHIETRPFDAQAWQLRLSGESGRWRLRGVLERDRAGAELTPAVSADG